MSAAGAGTAQIQDNDFQLFGLKERFAQDRAEIDRLWKDLQRLAHPDRFSAEPAAAQRLAMQWSVRINEAYQRLKDPVRRAAYLCELRGVVVQGPGAGAMPLEFLEQQMVWREALDEAEDASSLEAVAAEVRAARERALTECERALDAHQEPLIAAEQVRALMFIQRFEDSLNDRMDALDSLR